MKTAMLLAAGRGKRLRPLTDTRPKPLCKVQGKALIEHHVERLAQKGFERIIINHAHLGGQIRKHLGRGSAWGIEIIYSPEPPGGLETGGGIVNALPLLGVEPFLAVNADIFTDYAFEKIKLTENILGHIVLVPSNPSLQLTGDFSLQHGNLISNHPGLYTFSGIACYHPKLFNNFKAGRFSVTPILRAAAEQQLLQGELYQGLWFDTGSVQRLAEANKSISRNAACLP